MTSGCHLCRGSRACRHWTMPAELMRRPSSRSRSNPASQTRLRSAWEGPATARCAGPSQFDATNFPRGRSTRAASRSTDRTPGSFVWSSWNVAMTTLNCAPAKGRACEELRNSRTFERSFLPSESRVAITTPGTASARAMVSEPTPRPRFRGAIAESKGGELQQTPLDKFVIHRRAKRGKKKVLTFP